LIEKNGLGIDFRGRLIAGSAGAIGQAGLELYLASNRRISGSNTPGTVTTASG
jgi:hypothetical protein